MRRNFNSADHHTLPARVAPALPRRSEPCIAAKAARSCPSWVKRATSVRSRCSRNVRYASNTDRIDASQRNVAMCQKPTYSWLLDHLVGEGEEDWRDFEA
jgi:hypothetical protein